MGGPTTTADRQDKKDECVSQDIMNIMSICTFA